MNDTAQKNLMQLKGVGQATARRLVAAGLDDFARVAAAGEPELRAIRGLNPRSIPLILAQAAERAGTAAAGSFEREARAQQLREVARGLQETVAQLRERLASGKVAGKARRARLQKEVTRVETLLGRLEAALPARLKRTGKALEKAGRKLGAASGKGPAKTARALRKARRNLKKALA